MVRVANFEPLYLSHFLAPIGAQGVTLSFCLSVQCRKFSKKEKKNELDIIVLVNYVSHLMLSPKKLKPIIIIIITFPFLLGLR